MSEDHSRPEAKAASGSLIPSSPPNAAAAPAAPANKLHEWAAAIAIMAFLTAILVGVLFFMRGTSL